MSISFNLACSVFILNLSIPEFCLPSAAVPNEFMSLETSSRLPFLPEFRCCSLIFMSHHFQVAALSLCPQLSYPRYSAVRIVITVVIPSHLNSMVFVCAVDMLF
ncbi:hypothetical protein SLEP1_g56443 [Rubroshorea leprosula]|uniref:Secreted protein n=1 Tax=Rubroshorea leprosula TaxID=152421 RepID=A0AAV5MJP4_9ROSI|nr:hypothetical protein SLEP1_g56443 [Rubroshorea leprosula]